MNSKRGEIIHQILFKQCEKKTSSNVSRFHFVFFLWVLFTSYFKVWSRAIFAISQNHRETKRSTASKLKLNELEQYQDQVSSIETLLTLFKVIRFLNFKKRQFSNLLYLNTDGATLAKTILCQMGFWNDTCSGKRLKILGSHYYLPNRIENYPKYEFNACFKSNFRLNLALIDQFHLTIKYFAIIPLKNASSDNPSLKVRTKLCPISILLATSW